MSGKSNKYDGLLEAAQNRKPDYSKAQAKPEVGVSIQVGIGQSNTEGDAAAAEAQQIEDNLVEGGVYIEAPFDFDDCDY